MGFYFLRHIGWNDLFQFIVILVDLLNAMIEKRDQVSGVSYTNDDTRAVLCVLKAGSNTQLKLFGHGDMICVKTSFIFSNSCKGKRPGNPPAGKAGIGTGDL
jgi:hypothetical protein